MKKRITLLLLALVSVCFAQAPAGYYNSATSTGYALKTQLFNIINNHNDRGYSALWNLYTNTAFRDTYFENNNSLLDIYSENPSGPDSYEYTSTAQQCGSYSGEGSCYNREHLIPQSYFENYQIDPMKNDPLHVLPTDGFVNGARGNFPFGVVNNPASYTSTNGSKRGNNLNAGYSAGYTGTVFEPIDEFKGDIARCFLYFATRYENLMSNFYASANGTTTTTKAMFDGTNDKVFSDTFLSILIKWHLQDGVSDRERAINNAVYQYQNNRNPFIDRPEFVCQIWGSVCATLSNPTFNDLLTVTIYPNPSNDIVNIETNILMDEINIININGQIIQQIKNPVMDNNTYTISNLPKGFYFVRLTSDNNSVTKKIIIN